MKSLKAGMRQQQRGAVLVIGLIMLVVMTLFVISMLKTSIIELKIGGSSQVAALNLANAEVAINKFISDNNTRFASGFLNPGAVRPAIIAPPGVYGGTVTVLATEKQCTVWAPEGYDMRGTGALQAVDFDIAATAVGALGGSTRVHQGAEVLLPPCGCSTGTIC